MIEFEGLSQQAEGYRRLFTDADFELYVWYDRPGGAFRGFQLVYDRQAAPRALTWLEDEGFGHNAIDDGELSPGGPKSTPVLVPDGLFDKERIGERFERAAAGLEPEILRYVLGKIRDYEHEALNPLI